MGEKGTSISGSILHDDTIEDGIEWASFSVFRFARKRRKDVRCRSAMMCQNGGVSSSESTCRPDLCPFAFFISFSLSKHCFLLPSVVDTHDHKI